MDIRAKWALVTADLTRARNILPRSANTNELILQYQEFVDHNELELACDMLEDYAKDFPVNREFWFALRDAAANMQQIDRARRYQEFSISIAKNTC